MAKDTQSRKYQLTLNNPIDKGYTHDKIKEILADFKSLTYFCLSDEAGSTHHTHLYLCFSGGVRFSSIKSKFPESHIELARGTSEQNRDYIAKSGKWEKDTKHGTSIPGTFEESGELPVERQGARNDLADLYDMVKSGLTNYDIIEENPDYMLRLTEIEKVRQTLKEEEFKNTFRKLEVIYIWGKTETGKTRHVLETHGYEAVYRVTGYKNPFDGYKNQDVLLLEEFNSQLPIQLMLNILDGYPLMLPCRYADKTACYIKVYIISNLPITEQYPYEMLNQPEVWNAFKRRIHKTIKFPLPDNTDGSSKTDDSEDDENPFNKDKHIPNLFDGMVIDDGGNITLLK